MAENPFSVPYSSNEVELGVADSATLPAGTRGFIGVGYDGANTRFIKVNSSGHQIFVGAGAAGVPAGGVVSVQGVSGGQAVPVSGTFWQDTQPVSSTQLPASLLGGRLDTNIGSWFGATTPTLGQKTMAVSIPVVLSSNQSVIPVSQDGPPWKVEGTDADGAAPTENPVLVAGQDGTNVQTLKTNATGRLEQVLYDAAGNAVGVVLDGAIYRLQTEARLVDAVEQGSDRQDGQLGLPNVQRGTGGWSPEPSDRLHQVGADEMAFPQLDGDGQQIFRGKVHTDEGTFRDDFAEALERSLTGTVTFTTGLATVTGSGTLFTEELGTQDYIRLTADGQTDAAGIVEVISDTELRLASEYTGAGGSGAATASKWRFVVGTGGSITQSVSDLIITSGTTAFSQTVAVRYGDYLPLECEMTFSLAGRQANQLWGIGFRDPSTGVSALFLFDTDNPSQIKLQTGTDDTNKEVTSYLLPYGILTSAKHRYRISVDPRGVTAWVDGEVLAHHTLHVPKPYQELAWGAFVINYATLNRESVLRLDSAYIASRNVVQTEVVGQVASVLQDIHGHPVSVTHHDPTGKDHRLMVESEITADSPQVQENAMHLAGMYGELRRIRALLEILTDEHVEEDDDVTRR